MHSNKLVIGLTGGIGCGKSTVAEAFRNLGIEVICADSIARELVASDHPNLEKIVQHFGQDILINGQLNRSALQDRIFREPLEKKWLEELLHPQIRAKLAERVETAKSPYVILDIPLLLESAPNPMIDSILVVDCSPTQQRERVQLRDNTPTDVLERIIQQQVSRIERIRRADHLIDNTGTRQDLLLQIKKLHEIYLLKLRTIGK